MNDQLADACYKEDYDLAIELIKKGARENRELDWNRGLYKACEKGHKEVALLMIEKGANAWKWGLYDACYSGQKEMVELMISKGANDLSWGLCGACMGEHKELAFLMIKKGANMNKYNLDMTNNDILYLFQKEIPIDKKYQQTINHLIKSRKQTRELLNWILIDDLVGIIMSY